MNKGKLINKLQMINNLQMGKHFYSTFYNAAADNLGNQIRMEGIRINVYLNGYLNLLRVGVGVGK